MVGLLAIFTHSYGPEIGEFFLVNPIKTCRTRAETFHGPVGRILTGFLNSEKYNGYY
jgi:hypothetical protein